MASTARFAVLRLSSLLFLSGGGSIAQLGEGCEPAPALVTPSSGPSQGGTSVTISGTSFYGCCILSACPGPKVLFDTSQAQVVKWSGTEVTVITPPHADGVVNVTVDNFGTGIIKNGFTYTSSIPTLSGGFLLLLLSMLAALGTLCCR